MDDQSQAEGLAAEATELMLLDRDRAAALAEAALAAEPDERSSALAARVLAGVALARGAFSEAARWAGDAVDAAVRCGDGEVLGRCLMTRMGVLITTGQPEDALADATNAEPLLTGEERVKLLVQRASVLGLGLGRAREAIDLYDDIERRFSPLPPIVEAVLTMNRGSQLAGINDHERATADLARSRQLYQELRNVEAECDVLIHQARVAGTVGDFPGVFELHGEVERRQLMIEGDPRALNDLADAVFLAGLRHEAVALSERALEATDPSHITAAAPEAGLRLARIAAEDGIESRALELAAASREWSEHLGLDYLRLRSIFTEHLIRIAGGRASTADIVAIRSVASEMRAIGHVVEAEGIEVEAASAALDIGIIEQVGPLLESFDEPRAVDGRDHLGRARSHHAAALRALVAGDEWGALDELAAGIGVLEAMRSGIAALDLRTAAADRTPAMAALGLGIALNQSEVELALDWSERQRAAALRLVAPPGPELGASLTTRRSQRVGHAAGLAPVTSGEVRAQLGERCLVQFVEQRGDLHAIVVTAAGPEFVRGLLSMEEAEGYGRRLRFALRRLATSTDGPSGDGAALIVDELGAEFGRRAVEPVLRGCDEVVLIPTGCLHLMPWAVAPQLEPISWSVAPSASSWVRAERASASRSSLLAFRGPGLPAARDEIEAIGLADSGPATVADVQAGLSSADVVHLAAHGTFRNDNAQLSAIELADGRLFAHDLEGRTNPALLVLSACSVGTVDVLRGDEILGFPAVALSAGVRSLVAALLPVEDEAGRDFMTSFHHELRSSGSVALALREARSVASRSRRHRAAAMSFQLFGAS